MKEAAEILIISSALVCGALAGIAAAISNQRLITHGLPAWPSD